LAKFFRQSNHKIPQFGKKFRYFLPFVVIVLGTKTGSLALFSLSKFVFYTPNKNFSLAVNLCSAVDTIGPTVYLLIINKNKNNRYFSAISAKVPFQFLAVNIFFSTAIFELFGGYFRYLATVQY
jgi:hypothetical protein